MKRAICDGKTVIRFVTEYLDEMLQKNSEGALKRYKKTVRERQRTVRGTSKRPGLSADSGGRRRLGSRWKQKGNKKGNKKEIKGKQSAF